MNARQEWRTNLSFWYETKKEKKNKKQKLLISCLIFVFYQFPTKRYALHEADLAAYEWNVSRVLVHEMGHHFFGNWVRIETFGDLWLKESFAVLLPIIWAYESGGSEVGDLALLAQWVTCRRGISSRSTSCSYKEHPEEMYDSDSYGASALRLLNLLSILGDSFWDGVRLYLQTFGGKSADGHDLMRCLEQASKRSLRWWFHQWIFSNETVGMPKVLLFASSCFSFFFFFSFVFLVKTFQISICVDGDCASFRLESNSGFTFDMDLSDGQVFHFSQKSKSARCHLIDGCVLDFNVSQRVPIVLDKTKSRIPRSVLLATLANPTVSALTKVSLFQLLEPEDCHGVFTLEKRQKRDFFF